MKYIDRRFLLPLITILIGAVMVFMDVLDGGLWAGMAGTLVTGFMGLSGYQTRIEAEGAHNMAVARLTAGLPIKEETK
jgi:hypothetical protein